MIGVDYDPYGLEIIEEAESGEKVFFHTAGVFPDALGTEGGWSYAIMLVSRSSNRPAEDASVGFDGSVCRTEVVRTLKRHDEVLNIEPKKDFDFVIVNVLQLISDAVKRRVMSGPVPPTEFRTIHSEVFFGRCVDGEE